VSAQQESIQAELTPSGGNRADLLLRTRRRKWLIVALLIGSHFFCGLIGYLLSRHLAALSSPDTKWAREVAEHFLEAFVNENTSAAKAVSTREHSKEITRITTTGGPLSWTISSHHVDERSGQASFKGIMKGSSAHPGIDKRSFTLLMEKEEGRWKVSSFTLGAFQ
jgi:hypothetical protein